jgi:hypothetical protein
MKALLQHLIYLRADFSSLYPFRGVIVALNGETGALERKINAPTPDDQDEEPIIVIPAFIPDKTHQPVWSL